MNKNLVVRRSQTEAFKSIRASVKMGQIPQRPSISVESDSIAEQSVDINAKFSVLERKIAELGNLFIQRSRPTFDTTTLEICDHDIRTLTKDITNRITAIRNEIKKPIKLVDRDDAEIFLNLQQSQNLRLRNLVQQFRALQASRSLHQSDTIQGDDPISEMYADFEMDVTPDQMALLARSQEELQARNSELMNLVSMMNELNDMMRDVSLLVFEQGSILDRIDTQIEVAIEEVQRGNEELHEANLHHSSSGFMIYIGSVSALIILCLILIVVKKK